MKQVLSFVISFSIVLLGFFSTYLALTRYFFNSNFIYSLITALILIFILLSIFISSALIYKIDSKFTRYYYAFSMLWIGILCNFNIFLIVILGLQGLGLIFSFIVSVFLIRLILLFGTIALSAYGIFNAFNIKVKDYEVRIKDLPPFWHNKTIAQISDVHLGPIYRQGSLNRIINKINTLGVSAIFITGDLFDGMETDFSWIKEPFLRLKADQGVYYSFGNHDLLLGFTHVMDLLKDTNIQILDDKLVIKNDLQIIGINYSFNSQFNLHQAILEQVDYTEDLPSILLFHEPKHMNLALKAGIDLQFSGHTHGGQLFPVNLITTLYYRGYNAGLYQNNGFSLIINSGIGTWGPAMRTLGRGQIVRVKLLSL